MWPAVLAVFSAVPRSLFEGVGTAASVPQQCRTQYGSGGLELRIATEYLGS